MADRLRGKVAIVVGAGQTPGETIGNGKATAILFAREGAAVVVVDRQAEAAEETRRAIEAEGGKAIAVAANVTRSDECARIVDACLAQFGRLDVLHNNVGIGIVGGPVDLSEGDWDHVVDTNLKAMFLTCKQALPHMERQGGGAIVNISSLASIRCSPIPMLAYNSSKAAVNALTRSIAMQYATKGIRANAILPGLIHTPMAVDDVVRRYGVDREKLVRGRDHAVPMQHMGEAWDVAYAAVYLASDEARYVTGVLLPVDGGLSCKG
jgi:NAD(P)-dependent dehydrogenase (short-subunit alcohol dehydrogenase family)